MLKALQKQAQSTPILITYATASHMITSIFEGNKEAPDMFQGRDN